MNLTDQDPLLKQEAAAEFAMNGRLPRLLQATVVIGSTLTALLMAEVFVRLLLPQMLFVPWQDELDGVLTARPGVRGRFTVPDTYDTTISYNSQRFRGLEEYSQTPERAVVRIAALGDSMTFGVGANDDETYPVGLERRLTEAARRSSLARRVEVINAGNAGSGTGDQVLLFADWVASFQPHVVILNVHVNDVEDDYERKMFTNDNDGNVFPRPRRSLAAADSSIRRLRRLLDASSLYPFLAQHSHAFQLARRLVSDAIVSRRAAAFADKDETEETMHSSREKFSREGLPMTIGEIRWLKEKVRETNSRLVVAYLPPQWWTYEATSDRRWQSELCFWQLHLAHFGGLFWPTL